MKIWNMPAVALLSTMMLTALTACGGGGDGDSALITPPVNTSPLVTPSLTITPRVGEASLIWTRSIFAGAYTVNSLTTGEQFSNILSTSLLIANWDSGERCFTVTATNGGSRPNSPPSAQVCATPTPPTKRDLYCEGKTLEERVALGTQHICTYPGMLDAWLTIKDAGGNQIITIVDAVGDPQHTTNSIEVVQKYGPTFGVVGVRTNSIFDEFCIGETPKIFALPRNDFASQIEGDPRLAKCITDKGHLVFAGIGNKGNGVTTETNTITTSAQLAAVVATTRSMYVAGLEVPYSSSILSGEEVIPVRISPSSRHCTYTEIECIAVSFTPNGDNGTSFSSVLAAVIAAYLNALGVPLDEVIPTMTSNAIAIEDYITTGYGLPTFNGVPSSTQTKAVYDKAWCANWAPFGYPDEVKVNCGH